MTNTKFKSATALVAVLKERVAIKPAPKPTPFCTSTLPKFSTEFPLQLAVQQNSVSVKALVKL